MGGIVVTDQMQGFVFRRFPINLAQKRQPLAVPMMWLTAGNDFAVQNIQCSKQRGGAVTLIIMSHGCGASSLQGQSWLRTIQRLNLAFFITAEYQSMFRRMQIQTYHILQLLHEFWITRNLEGLDQMRLQSVCAPYPSHARGAYSRNRRQSAGAPVRRVGRCSLRGQMHRVGAVAVIVDAINDEAVGFYRHYDFQQFPEQLNELLLPMKTIAQMF